MKKRQCENSEENSWEIEMGLVLVCFIFFMPSPSVGLVSAADRLEPGKPLSVNQTIVSSGGIFALGFFPGKSTYMLYAGIWYNKIPNTPVVWVANREKPLLEPSGVLTIGRDGNIAILGAAGNTLWSSNVSGIASNTTAVLQDDGNLVLRGQGGNIWRSFDHPTDTMLPGMKLVSNFRSNVFNRLTAWRDAEDPSPGDFSFGFDPVLFLQTIIWHGSEAYARKQVWNGSPIEGMRAANTASTYVVCTYEAGGEWLNLTFSGTQGSVALRYILDSTGSFKGMLWNSMENSWTVAISHPARPCEFYNSCGPFAICNMSSPSLTCSCLQRYKPRNQVKWDQGNFSEGCVRQEAFKCDAGDSFERRGGLKLPDKFTLMINISAVEQCEAECLRRCNCIAYAYAVVGSWSNGSWCLLWVGVMLDLTLLEEGGQDLHIRHAASELVTNSTSDQNSSNKNIPLLVILPTLASVMFLVGICYILKRSSKRQETRVANILLPDETDSSAVRSREDTIDLQLLNFITVVSATDNFSDVNKLGEGGFGPVYKGILPQGQDIAVKRLSKCSGQGFEEFMNEVDLIARLQHTNLVKLLAWCIHQDEKLLIYEYLPNKSLDKFIFDPMRSIELDWCKRTRIIEGIAQGILYLHRYSRLRVIHRDLKTSNILLDDAMNPKISDFGLARKFAGNQAEGNTSKVVGTIGYMSPEYALNGLFSDKSDVFSFGVIILEIVSSKRSTGVYLCDESLNLLGYAWKLWEEGRSLELVDSSIKTVCESEALKFIQLGLLCIQEKPADRPTMSSIITMLASENAVMPSPKHPAFIVGRDPGIIVQSLSPRKSNMSINGITLSVVEGR